MREQTYERELRRLIHGNDRLMALLGAVRDCDPPDWLVGAGTIRNLVWDHLHGYVLPTAAADVDVAFFDAGDLSPAYDQVMQRRLCERMPDIPWEATNQAAVHLWYEHTFGYMVPPLVSSADAIGTWPETATSVGVRLLSDDDLLVVAPCGLSDLFELILRRNPRRVSVEQFHRRMREKQILQKWPRVRVIDPACEQQ